MTDDTKPRVADAELRQKYAELVVVRDDLSDQADTAAEEAEKAARVPFQDRIDALDTQLSTLEMAIDRGELCYDDEGKPLMCAVSGLPIFVGDDTVEDPVGDGYALRDAVFPPIRDEEPADADA